MRVLLVAIGSMGDNLPFLSIGKALRARGHEPILLASGYFEKMAADAGLGFESLQTAERYMEFVHNQRTWTGLEAVTEMLNELLEVTPIVHEKVIELSEGERTVVAAQGYAFGARIAQETHKIPLATIHLQPMWLRSIYHAPGAIGKFPHFFLRWVTSLTDRVIDKRIAPRLNPYREQFGLPPAKLFMKEWWNSPRQVIGLFPDWYTAPEPDWPANTTLAGFPLEPASDASFEAKEDVESFLRGGEPPLIFSQSSITSDTQYYEISAKVAQALGKRAIFLTPHADIIPAGLPDTVRHYSFVPLDWILPRSAAFVHHGGIGTIAHALRAGVPQLTVPMVYDQTDNSQRLTPLGASGYLSRKAYKVPAVTKKLRLLLTSEQVADRCRDYSQRIQQTDGLGNVCRILEGLGE